MKTFCFYEGLTLKEIGKALNLTQGRVTQILKRTLIKLRDIEDEPPRSYRQASGRDSRLLSRLEAYAPLCYHLRGFDHAHPPEGTHREV